MATVISQVLVTLVFIYYLLFRNRSYVTFNLKYFKYNFVIIQDIFRLGLPASLSMIIMSLGIILFNYILGSPQAVAAYQTAGRIEHLFFLPILCLEGHSLLFLQAISILTLQVLIRRLVHLFLFFHFYLLISPLYLFFKN